jgi:hypothetical protein
MEVGSHQEHGLETNPHPKPELQRAFQSRTPRRAIKCASTKATTIFLTNSPTNSPTRGFISAKALGLRPRTSMYVLPNSKGLYHNPHNKGCNCSRDDRQVIYFKHISHPIRFEGKHGANPSSVAGSAKDLTHRISGC